MEPEGDVGAGVETASMRVPFAFRLFGPERDRRAGVEAPSTEGLGYRRKRRGAPNHCQRLAIEEGVAGAFAYPGAQNTAQAIDRYADGRPAGEAAACCRFRIGLK